jgi:hypothetical protein
MGFFHHVGRRRARPCRIPISVYETLAEKEVDVWAGLGEAGWPERPRLMSREGGSQSNQRRRNIRVLRAGGAAGAPVG